MLLGVVLLLMTGEEGVGGFGVSSNETTNETPAAASLALKVFEESKRVTLGVTSASGLDLQPQLQYPVEKD